MTSPEEKKGYFAPEDKDGKSTKSRIIRIAVIVAIAAAVLLGAKYYMGAKDRKAEQAAQQQKAAASARTLVTISEVGSADLANTREYIGNVESIQTVSVKPQVDGQIMSVNFREGSMVRAGQTLFVIDKSQYAATVALRRAQIAQAKADLDKASKYLKRVKAADPRSISATDLDTAQSTMMAAQASLAQANANLQLAEIDLRHTNITSPITGRIGKALITKGNYVTKSTAALATIVQTDPVRVTFNMPDRDYLDQIAVFKKGNQIYKTTLKLSNGQEINASGTRDFEDNQVNSQTGSIAMRVRYRNASGELVPGSMVRISTQPLNHKIITVIPQEAVAADLQGDFVYVVDAGDVARQRRVQLGNEYGSMREVISGVKTGERLVTLGVQSVVPGKKVEAMKAETTEGTMSDSEKAKQSDSDLTDTSKDSQGAK